MIDKLLSISEARKYLNVSRATIDRWQKKGLIQPVYTPGGHRRFKEADLRAMLGLGETKSTNQAAVVYARVSTRKQAEAGNLTRQEERLIAYSVKKGYQVVETLTEIASGVNERRAKLGKALNLIATGQANILVIEYQDRLARFGYPYLELFVTTHGGRIEIVEAQAGTSANEELVNDLIAIVTSFSARIYGKRGGKQVSRRFQSILKEKNKDDTGNNPSGNAS